MRVWPGAGTSWSPGEQLVLVDPLADGAVVLPARVAMDDEVDVDRHPLGLGEEVGDADRREGDRAGDVHRV
jgi:hypothetical protein